MALTFPAELTLRAPALADAQEIADLVRACELADAGSSDTNAEEIQDLWRTMDLEKSAFVLANAQGQIVGVSADADLLAGAIRNRVPANHAADPAGRAKPVRLLRRGGQCRAQDRFVPRIAEARRAGSFRGVRK